jgi:predicted HicB family RNase H-like nuclease
MSGEGAFDDIDAALANAFGEPEVAALVDKDKRRKREKRMALSPDDGRRKRATGRTKQFNCKMKPDLHKRIVQASRKYDISITVMVERAMQAIIGELERGGKNA